MGRNRRKRHKTRTEDDGSATSGTGDHQDGRCSQTVAGSSVIFTSSSPKTTSASSRQTSKATFTPSPSRINATDHASGSGSPRLSRDGPHSSQNQPQQRHDSPHSSQNHPQQRHDSLHSSQNQPQQRHDKRKKTKTTQSDVSVQSHKDLRYNSPSPQKRSRTSASDFENTCRSFSPRRRQKWGPGPEHTPPQKRGKTSTQSHRRGGKHHPGQFQHRQAAEAGRPYSSTKGKRRSDSASDSHQTSPASSLGILV
ncbi:hypothetical protein BaRGS_00015230 [Batillaria attramentaria]|uniref:Uncharacterized protein n=1 Tax=Batillaria attramentaria TaxID=370345 RepID=A0ABD0L278_9CAEN